MNGCSPKSGNRGTEKKEWQKQPDLWKKKGYSHVKGGYAQKLSGKKMQGGEEDCDLGMGCLLTSRWGREKWRTQHVQKNYILW